MFPGDSFHDVTQKPVVLSLTIFACFSVLWHVFLYLLNQRMAIYHQEGQLRIFYLARSVPQPNSAFLWKTAVILIDEIQRCPKQSGGSPTVAHRRGAPVLSLFLRKKGARPENTRGKNHDFQFKRARKAAFLYRQWESGGKPFPLAGENNTSLAFFPLDAFSYKGMG